GDVAYSGSIAKQGDMQGVVTAIGNATFFGRTAKLVASAGVLCSDKTGTLTQNKLTLSTPIPFGNTKSEDVVFGAALATKANSEDAIDAAVLKAITDPKALGRFKQTKLVPFDPVNKRTMTTVVDANGKTWQYAKGAPQAISALCKLDPTTEGSYSTKVDDLAKHGYRALGVASSSDDGQSWTLLGLLPLEDPPRPDAKATIAQTKGLGLSVKMVTGDDVAIGSEIAEQLGLGTHLLVAG